MGVLQNKVKLFFRVSRGRSIFFLPGQMPGKDPSLALRMTDDWHSGGQMFGAQKDRVWRSGGQKSGAAATVAAAPEDTLIKRVMYWRTAHLSELPKEARRHTGKMRERKARTYV